MINLTSASLPLLYTLAVFVVLGGYIAYIQFSSLRWSQSEVRLLDRLELHLGQVLRLLEAADVQLLLRDGGASRRRLFLSFSEDLRQDVVKLVRSRKLGPMALILAITFVLTCTAMRLKARLFCGVNDLRFLTGLELTLLRQMEKVSG